MDDAATYSSLDYTYEERGKRRRFLSSRKKRLSSWHGPRILKRWFSRRKQNAEDQKTVNLSADSTSPNDESSFPRPKGRAAKSSLPEKQIFYMPKFTDPSAAFGSDDVESFFAQLDVKDDNAAVYLALEGTEVVLCKDDDTIGANTDLRQIGKPPKQLLKAIGDDKWDGFEPDAPVREISFLSSQEQPVSEFEASGFSDSFEQMNVREEIFASFIDDEKGSQSIASLTKRQKLENANRSGSKGSGSRDTFNGESTTSSQRASQKETTAMLKRKSAFTGKDLLTQEAEVFSEYLEKHSPGNPPSPIRSTSRNIQLSESRLMTALSAVDLSDEEGSAHPSSFIREQFHATLAAAREAATEPVPAIPTTISQGESSTTSDVFSRINVDGSTGEDMNSRLSYDASDLTNSFAPSVPSAYLRNFSHEEVMCMDFFFPNDNLEDDFSLHTDDLSDWSPVHRNDTSEDAVSKFQRLVRKSTFDFFGL